MLPCHVSVPLIGDPSLYIYGRGLLLRRCDSDRPHCYPWWTFTPIHNGHRALLHTAFQTASHDGDSNGHVIVALTSTTLAKQTRSDPAHAELLGPFHKRRKSLATELDHVNDAYSASYEIIQLEDSHGPAATREDVDALIVSPEAKAQQRAYDLNKHRTATGLAPLEIHTAPFVIAEDGTPISGTRIRNGEIDAHGRLLDSGD